MVFYLVDAVHVRGCDDRASRARIAGRDLLRDSVIAGGIDSTRAMGDDHDCRLIAVEPSKDVRAYRDTLSRVVAIPHRRVEAGGRWQHGAIVVGDTDERLAVTRG